MIYSRCRSCGRVESEHPVVVLIQASNYRHFLFASAEGKLMFLPEELPRFEDFLICKEFLPNPS